MRPSAMKVKILAKAEVIGASELDRLDPPMGVAIGAFTPTIAYDRNLHAGDIEGKENQLGSGAALTVEGPQGKVDCAGVHIADFSDSLGEIEVHVLGISNFEALFGDHPHFRSYYRLD
jgi:hypothetical protein